MSAALTTSTIDSVFGLKAALDDIQQTLEKADLLSLTRRLRLNRLDLHPYDGSREGRVSIHEVYRSRYVEVSCLSWRTGQRSRIHDHRGSACCVLVIDGVLINTDFCVQPNGTLSETGRIALPAGAILVRHDQQIHRCANQQAGKELLTLHLYSPPLVPLAKRAYGGPS